MSMARSAAEYTAAHPELERELGAALDDAARRQATDPLLFVVRTVLDLPRVVLRRAWLGYVPI